MLIPCLAWAALCLGVFCRIVLPDPSLFTPRELSVKGIAFGALCVVGWIGIGIFYALAAAAAKPFSLEP